MTYILLNKHLLNIINFILNLLAYKEDNNNIYFLCYFFKYFKTAIVLIN